MIGRARNDGADSRHLRWSGAVVRLTQPRLNDLLSDKVAKFSLDAPIGISTVAGLSVSLEIAAAG
ncbi:hypothetical protein [Bosea sp. (in: a-proteobacteria)]|uniref:hypothetical protein n=1 Tax=Bosea sp. (in: a-proteobacteria) TaxID=1871050 RepID=UPI00356B287A